MQDIKHFERKPIISVIGSAVAMGHEYSLAYDIGKGLIDRNYILLTGGMGGIMEASHRGARESDKWCIGSTIGIIPSSNTMQANPYVDIVIPTGLDHGRNMVVAQSRAVIAISGGAGTLSEMAFAWIYKKLVIALRVSGWSKKLADRPLDDRIRYANISDDKIFGADTAEDVFEILDNKLSVYSGTHSKIQ